MEINSCLSCNEALNTESSEINLDNESMEVSLFEDLNKQKIINNIAKTEEQVILCKSCSYLLEITLEKQISEAEEYLKNLDFSIAKAQEIIPELYDMKIPEISENEELLLENESLQTLKLVNRHKQEIADLDREILNSNKMQIEGIYDLMSRADCFLEHETKSAVLQTEMAYLKNKPLLLRAFIIGVKDSIGTINGMRLGSLDKVSVTWDEINAAWGQSAFLLYVLFETSGFQSKNISIYPSGPHSRISYKKDDDQRFELFLSDPYNKNLVYRFNKAQSLFVEMLKEYQTISKELGAPYSMDNGKIGGILVKFELNLKEAWTQSLRFILQDLNYFLQKSVI